MAVQQLPQITAPSTAGTATTGRGTSIADQSAKAIIQATLAAYGLSSLADWAWTQYTGGAATEQIMLDMRQRPEYKTRFPAMEALAKSGHAMSEGQYVQYETTVTGLMRAAGLPTGFYDQPGDFTKFLTNQVSAQEIQSRVQNAQAAIYSSSPETRAQLDQMYQSGAAPGDITAFFLDPNRAEPLLAKQWAAAQASGQAITSGYAQGGLGTADAEYIAQQGLSQDAVRSGFSDLTKQKSAFTAQAGAHDDTANQLVSAHDQLTAAFGGDTETQKKILGILKQRDVDQQGGGTYQEDKNGAGYTGLGVQQQ